MGRLVVADQIHIHFNFQLCQGKGTRLQILMDALVISPKSFPSAFSQDSAVASLI